MCKLSPRTPVLMELSTTDHASRVVAHRMRLSRAHLPVACMQANDSTELVLNPVTDELALQMRKFRVCSAD